MPDTRLQGTEENMFAAGGLIFFICHFRYESITNSNQRLSRACIVHLVIKRTSWFYVKTMSCSGSHLGIPINIKNTKFVKDLPMIDDHWKILYKVFVFYADRKSKMAATTCHSINTGPYGENTKICSSLKLLPSGFREEAF
jgi:hypothetical protein